MDQALQERFEFTVLWDGAGASLCDVRGIFDHATDGANFV